VFEIIYLKQHREATTREVVMKMLVCLTTGYLHV